MKTVVVGMSGGVDSSVVAYLLKEQGYRVIGIFMKNWEEEGCRAEADYRDVVAVCSMLDIPHYTVNFSREYWENVFKRCLNDYAAGLTPNPDILCNQEIKFKAFFDKAMRLGADYLATGHYCRKQNGYLARGADPEKDQSYFLYTVESDTLSRVLFPLGEMNKGQVRGIARKAGLPTAEKKDSTGICFIGKRNFKEFLSRFLPKNQGFFETSSGKRIGSHDGCHFYTVGQRRGLNIGGAGEAWYVVGKKPQHNVVVVEQGDHHPALFASRLTAVGIKWRGSFPGLPFACTAKIRYRSPDAACVLEHSEGNRIFVSFAEPQKAITPGQAIVFYHNEICLGGGRIEGIEQGVE